MDSDRSRGEEKANDSEGANLVSTPGTLSLAGGRSFGVLG